MSGRNRRSDRDSGPSQGDIHAQALGRAVKVLRTEQGIDRAELAEAAEVSYPYLSEIENGKKRPSSRTLEALAEALGLRAHELLAAADSRVDSIGADDAAYLMAEEPPRTPARKSWFSDEARLTTVSTESGLTIEAQARELAELLRRLSPENAELVLELARRLVR